VTRLNALKARLLKRTEGSSLPVSELAVKIPVDVDELWMLLKVVEEAIKSKEVWAEEGFLDTDLARALAPLLAEDAP
jgi:hypothetical protein